ncbi:MAG: amidohydrolase [Pseudomonadota bacterium]
MTNIFSRLVAPIAALSAVALSACGTGNPPTGPDSALPEPFTDMAVAYTGGVIYTGNPDQPVAGIVMVDTRGRILDVVDYSEAQNHELPSDVLRVDLEGAFMFPGFVDSHAHLSGIGERELSLDLAGTASLVELVTRVEAEVDGLDAGRVLVGRGWIETGWPEGRMPVAADLDAVAPNHPVILTRADGHALVANTAALVAVGDSADTPDPEGGRIERDADGAATGLLIDTAMGLVAPLIAAPTEADVLAKLETGASVYASRGWTGLHNMSVTAQEARLMAQLSDEGRLPIRVHNGVVPEAFDLAGARDHETGTITNRAVKLYMDGALGSRGAQLIASYADRPGERGLSLTSDTDLRAFMERAAEANVQLAIHAIGDLANRRVVEACEETGLCAGQRWRIEHAQIIAPEDLPRLSEQGLIASMQPSHAIGDLFFAPDRLGLERLDGAYAWADLLVEGTVIAGGSDAPVEVGSPLIEFYAAVARTSLDGFQGEGWHPEQAVMREEALAMFTSAPAFASFQEDDLGTIEVGKWADFTVFDRDLMTIPAPEILEAEAVMTVVKGDVIFRRLE